MDLASVVAHHLIRLQQPIEIYTSMLLKTIAHNPLVRSSTLRGGTIKTLLHPLRCFVDVLSAPTARKSIAYTVWQSSNTCLALSLRD